MIKPNCSNCTPNGYCADRLREVLRGHQGRLTSERLRLLKIVCDCKGHFRPEDLARQLREDGFNISLTTVYRNLGLLVRAGIIRKVCAAEGSPRGGSWYEHIWDHQHHDHLICSRCGKTIEFTYPAIDVLQEAIAREYGFTLEGHRFELVGVCAHCRGAERTDGT